MRLIKKLRDKLRTMAGIRAERQLPPPGEKPPIGSNIVREKLRMRLKYPVSDELWKWLSRMGWRVLDMRSNQRRYILVPDKVLMKFIQANDLERHVLHGRLIKGSRYHQSAMDPSMNLPNAQDSSHRSAKYKSLH